MALVVGVVAAAYLAFVGARLVVFDGDPSGFVTAGELTTDAAAAPDHLLVTSGTRGYDGQAYFRLARDPLTNDVTADGITFTRPAYWQSRIGYPLAAWVVSAGGHGPWVPGAMVAVNLLAVVALVLLAARWALSRGRSAWWGAVPAAWAGYVVGVGQDLTEPLAGALMLASLYAMRVGSFVPAAVALTAAALTRETTLVLAVAVLLGSIASLSQGAGSRPGRTIPPWWVGAVPLVAYAGWRWWVRARWSDQVPDPPSDNPLGAPLMALLDGLAHGLTHLGAQWPNLVLLLPTLAALVLAGTALRFREEPLHERIALAGYLLVLLCLPVWDRGQAYLRWGCEPMLLGWLLLVGRPRCAVRTESARTGGRDDLSLAALSTLSVAVWLVAATQSVGYPRLDGPWSAWWTWS
ncbi:hypothetical protein [Nocardioides sp.]|uniref:hypothetical protein n=1 Tax=Nocardioides sp. TaxID=35761 RepID=UPI002D18ED7C|nr:hypothetical protein [Nocardioides sp.]HXH77520.1 hypothetical protein [Nocardioides sp.]